MTQIDASKNGSTICVERTHCSIAKTKWISRVAELGAGCPTEMAEGRQESLRGV